MNIDIHLPVDQDKFVEVNLTDRQITIELWDNHEVVATTSELFENIGIAVSELLNDGDADE